MFEYMTAQQAAEKWNVSLRWVQRLCKENRVEGALNINRVWLIPQNTVKPDDARKKKNKNNSTCAVAIWLGAAIKQQKYNSHILPSAL